jgi:gas vesicle protein
MIESRKVGQESEARTKRQSPTLAESLVNDVSNEAKELRDEGFDQAKDIGTQVKRAAGALTNTAGDLLDTAKSLASDTGDEIEDVVTTQKAAGADRISGVASAIRRAADDIEKEIPSAAPYIRLAAGEIDDFAEALKTQSLGEIVGVIEDFAHRQPAAFLGIAAIAGFAMMRLLKVPLKAGQAS